MHNDNFGAPPIQAANIIMVSFLKPIQSETILKLSENKPTEGHIDFFYKDFQIPVG
jgi:hypothetical protein